MTKSFSNEDISIENLTKDEKIMYLHNLIINGNEINEVLKYRNSLNILKILRSETSELKHSNILSWLLESSESHNLSDSFLNTWFNELLQSNWENIKNCFSIEKFLLNSLDTFTVYRERWNIDILLVSEHNKQVIVVENKIKTSEHSNQLIKYETRVNNEYPDYEKLFLYLTPNPSSIQTLSSSRWIVIGYDSIYNSISNILNNQKNIDSMVALIMNNYLETIRSEVMEDDAEIKKLSLEIYKKYRTALDIIFEYKPDQQQNMKDLIDEVLRELKTETNNIILLPSAKAYIRFTTTTLHNIYKGCGNGTWIKGMHELLVLEIVNTTNSNIHIKLLLGPSDNEHIRNSLIETVKDNKKDFPNFVGRGKQYTQLFRKNILNQTNVGEFLSDEKSKEKLKRIISNILNNEVKKIEKTLSLNLPKDSYE